MNAIKVNIFPANERTAQANREGIITIARDGARIFVEYLSRSTDNKVALIIFQKTDDGILAWHHCQAEKSGYQKGCWHLAISSILYGLTPVYEVEIVGTPDQDWAVEDITPAFLNKSGEFAVIKLKPEGGERPREIAKALTGHELLDKYRLPKSLQNRVVEFRDCQIGRLTPSQVSRIPQGVNYIPQGNEVVFAVGALMYDNWSPPLMMGPAGSGKTTLAEALAEILYLPMRRISGGIDVNAAYLMGEKTLTPIEEPDDLLAAKLSLAAAKAGSPLTPEEFELVQAKLKTSHMRVTHEAGVLLQAARDGELILVDEINMLIPEVTSLLHSLLDWQKCITVAGVGEVKAHPDFRLVGAMNVGYMGTRPLNKAFRDRFRGIQVQSISDITLKSLLEKYVSDEPLQILSRIYQELYKAVYSPIGATLSESCISLRSLLRAAQEYSMGLGSLKSVVTSCLTESLESESERNQVRDIIDMQLK